MHGGKRMLQTLSLHTQDRHCGQGENVKNVAERKNKTYMQFYTQYDILKKLTTKRTHERDNLMEISLNQRKNIHKLKRIIEKQSILNKSTAELDKETSTLNSKLQKQSDDFIKKIAAIDDDLKKLHSQFEGETVSTLVNNVSNDLGSSENIKKHLQREYEKHSQVKLDDYERFPIVNMFTNELEEDQKLKNIEKIISEKREKIEHLTMEIEKMSQLHQL
ncbi:uncharacterized protein isoform X1 [Leptinotarsa decemlineata]|uniref:uncharacterized protein isoform X1 n=2 Tax=Leptinotarsa decemlineata TaxID=7539 RepID=UPI003D306665